MSARESEELSGNVGQQLLQGLWGWGVQGRVSGGTGIGWLVVLRLWEVKELFGSGLQAAAGCHSHCSFPAAVL